MQKYDMTDVDFLSSLSIEAIGDTVSALRECGLLKLPYTEFAIEYPIDLEFLIAGPKPCLCRDDGSKIQPGSEEHYARLRVECLASDPDETIADAVVGMERTLWGRAPEIFTSVDETPGEALVRYRDLRKRHSTSPMLLTVRGKMGASGDRTYDIDHDSLTAISLENISIATGRPHALQAVLVLLTALATRGAQKVEKANKRAALGIGNKDNRKFEYITKIQIDPAFVEDDLVNPPGTGTHRSPHLHLRAAHYRHQRFGAGNLQTKLIFIQATIVRADSQYVATRKSYRVLH